VKKIARAPRIAYDEWNVWFRTEDGALEERYNFPDAPRRSHVPEHLNPQLRLGADRETWPRWWNAIAPIVTSPDAVAVQPIYYPVLMHARAALDVAVDVHVNAPMISPLLPDTHHSRWPHRVADLGPFAMVGRRGHGVRDRGRLALTLVNRNPDEPETIEVVLRDLAFDSDAQIATVTGGARAAVPASCPMSRARTWKRGRTPRKARRSTLTLPPQSFTVVEAATGG